MRVTCPDFEQNGPIPSKCSCDGGDERPSLVLEKVPEDAVSFAIVMDDPDAPSGTWVHWTAWNIPSAETEIGSGRLPDGAVEGRTSAGGPGYHGPCPPSGMHRYFFKVFALDTMLDLAVGTTVEDLMSAMDGHVLDKAGLVGTYERN